MNPKHWLEQQLVDSWPPEVWKDTTVLAAVSGGADSMALLCALLATRRSGSGRLIIAHFNHGLRSAESDGDERFVREFSGSRGLDCEVGRVGGPAAGGPPRPSEADLRQVRYAFLQDAAAKHGARYVVTAHTADDQAETVLHRILRGTGLDGLGGMRRFRELIPGVALARPLLSVRRCQVLDYLAANRQPFRDDSSNLARNYTRNRLRLDLIPQLQQQYNAEVVPALARLATLADEAQQVIADRVDLLLPAACGPCAEGVALDCQVLRPERPLLVREVLVSVWKQQGWPQQAMSYGRWEQLRTMIVETLPAGCRRQAVFPGGVVAERTGERLALRNR